MHRTCLPLRWRFPAGGPPPAPSVHGGQTKHEFVVSLLPLAQHVVQQCGAGLHAQLAVGLALLFGEQPLVQRLDNRQRIAARRSEEHTSELQSLMRISYAVFCLKKKKTQTNK